MMLLDKRPTGWSRRGAGEAESNGSGGAAAFKGGMVRVGSGRWKGEVWRRCDRGVENLKMIRWEEVERELGRWDWESMKIE